jgi:hypothetical protein
VLFPGPKRIDSDAWPRSRTPRHLYIQPIAVGTCIPTTGVLADRFAVGSSSHQWFHVRGASTKVFLLLYQYMAMEHELAVELHVADVMAGTVTLVRVRLVFLVGTLSYTQSRR